MYAYYILSLKCLGSSPILSIFYAYVKYLYLLVVKRVTKLLNNNSSLESSIYWILIYNFFI